MMKWLANLLIQGYVQATKFITTGGTSSDFVKGDGSLDNTVYSTQQDIDDSIDNIEIGGRNLLVGEQINVQAGNIIKNNIDKYHIEFIKETPVNNGYIMWNSNVGVVVDALAGEYVTFSAYYKSDFKGSVRLRNGVEFKEVDLENTNDNWVRVTITTKAIVDNPSVWIYFMDYRTFNEYGTFEVLNWKLEKGNKATYWTPAPEDQITDWDETNPDSFSFLKNKPNSFPPSAHTHTIGEVTNLQTALNNKEDAFSKNTAFNKNFGTTAGTVAEGNHTHSNLSTGTGLTGSTYNGGTARTFAFDTAWGDERYLQSFTETDPTVPSHVKAITTGDINDWNAKGVQLTADQPTAKIHLRDSAGNIISTLDVGFLNNEGTTIVFNNVTDEIELRNDDDELLSSFPASALMTGVGYGLNLTGSTLELTDSTNNTIDSVTLTIANIQGLQTALEGKALKTTQITAGTGLSGGGTLEANRTFNVNFGTSAGTVAEGNDVRLSDEREWTASTVEKPEAEAGTATTRRAWTAQRVRQAIVAWWNTIANTIAEKTWVSANFDHYGKWGIKINNDPSFEVESNDYIALVDGDGIKIENDSGVIMIGLSSPMPTKTSDLINDGEDGQSPFISYSDIYTENQIINSSVINVPNTLTYRVSVFEYIIDGVFYNTPVIDDSIVLSPITGNNRIDVIALDFSDPLNHEIVVITGTPAQSPAKPNIDSETQLEITFVIVSDGESSPSGVRSKIIYNENLQIAGGEANTYTNFPADIDFNDTSNAYVGSKSIKAINYDDANRSNRYMEFELDEVFYNEEFDKLVLHSYVDSKEHNNSSPVLFLHFVSPSGIESAMTKITPMDEEGYQFNEWFTHIAEHSQLTILDQNAYEEGVKKIRIYLGKSYDQYIYIDYIFFQGGVAIPTQSMHNSLQGLQGGIEYSLGGIGEGGGKEYYHLSKANYEKVGKIKGYATTTYIETNICLEHKQDVNSTRYIINTPHIDFCVITSQALKDTEIEIINYLNTEVNVAASSSEIYSRPLTGLGAPMAKIPSRTWMKVIVQVYDGTPYFLIVNYGELP